MIDWGIMAAKVFIMPSIIPFILEGSENMSSGLWFGFFRYSPSVNLFPSASFLELKPPAGMNLPLA